MIVTYAVTDPKAGFLGISAFAVPADLPGVTLGAAAAEDGAGRLPGRADHLRGLPGAAGVPARHGGPGLGHLPALDGLGAGVPVRRLSRHDGAAAGGLRGARQRPPAVRAADRRLPGRLAPDRRHAAAAGERAAAALPGVLADGPGRRPRRRGRASKIAVSEAAVANSTDAMQIFGGSGLPGWAPGSRRSCGTRCPARSSPARRRSSANSSRGSWDCEPAPAGHRVRGAAPGAHGRRGAGRRAVLPRAGPAGQRAGAPAQGARGARAATGWWSGSEKSAAVVVAMQAVLRLGAAYVPADGSAPVTRVAVMARGLRGERGADHRGPDGRSGHVTPRLPGGPPCLDLAADCRSRRAGLDEAVEPDDLAYILYTSGSTGSPQGRVHQPPQRAGVRGLGGGPAVPGPRGPVRQPRAVHLRPVGARPVRGIRGGRVGAPGPGGTGLRAGPVGGVPRQPGRSASGTPCPPR